MLHFLSLSFQIKLTSEKLCDLPFENPCINPTKVLTIRLHQPKNCNCYSSPYRPQRAHALTPPRPSAGVDEAPLRVGHGSPRRRVGPRLRGEAGRADGHHDGVLEGARLHRGAGVRAQAGCSGERGQGSIPH